MYTRLQIQHELFYQKGQPALTFGMLLVVDLLTILEFIKCSRSVSNFAILGPETGDD
jgi:hypothetical protein